MFTLSDNEVVQRFFNVKGFLCYEIKVIETTNNVGQNYANALYQSYDVTSYSRLLWQDPTLTGWNCRTSYRWTIQHTPSQGILRSVLPPFSELKMCPSIDSINTKGTLSPVLRKLTSVLFLYEEF